jgi:hypothetical protein
MEEWPLGPEEIEMIRVGRADEVERRLLVHYDLMKAAKDPKHVFNAASCLAHFYTRTNDMLQAERYFREGIAAFPCAESALEMVFFSYFVLGDPEKTLREADVVRTMVDARDVLDFRFLYTSLAVEGQAQLSLRRYPDAARNLEEMVHLAEHGKVVFGDEFEFVRQMVAQRQSIELCKKLLKIARSGVRSAEYGEKMDQLLSALV